MTKQAIFHRRYLLKQGIPLVMSEGLSRRKLKSCYYTFQNISHTINALNINLKVINNAETFKEIPYYKLFPSHTQTFCGMIDTAITAFPQLRDMVRKSDSKRF